MSLGREIQKVRIDKGWKQKDLREALEISQKHMSRIENDDVDPSVSLFRRICVALDVSADRLLELPEPQVQSVGQKELETMTS